MARFFPPLGHPARTETQPASPVAQPARPEALPARPEAQPVRPEGQTASQASSLRLQAWLDEPEEGMELGQNPPTQNPSNLRKS